MVKKLKTLLLAAAVACMTVTAAADDWQICKLTYITASPFLIEQYDVKETTLADPKQTVTLPCKVDENPTGDLYILDLSSENKTVAFQGGDLYLSVKNMIGSLEETLVTKSDNFTKHETFVLIHPNSKKAHRLSEQLDMPRGKSGEGAWIEARRVVINSEDGNVIGAYTEVMYLSYE